MFVHKACVCLLITLFSKVEIADWENLKCVEILLNSASEKNFKFILWRNNSQEHFTCRDYCWTLLWSKG